MPSGWGMETIWLRVTFFPPEVYFGNFLNIENVELDIKIKAISF